MVRRAWGLRSSLSRGIYTVLHKVVEHLLATLDKVGVDAAFNLRNLVVVLVADTTVRNFAGRAQSLQSLLADTQILTHNLTIDPLLVDVACLL